MNSILGSSQERDPRLTVLAGQVDAFECYREPHALRVAAVAGALARSFNLASQDLLFLDQAALLHDIGEMRMNRDYISSNRPLTANDRIDLERHPVLGEQDVSKLGLPRGVQLIVRWHHEWWNGGGYPDRISGEQIPLTARILRVADTFASFTAARPFREALAPDGARAHIAVWAGIEFDPDIARALLHIEIPDINVAAPEPVIEQNSLSIA